ncbi:unknown protein (plasmid) [Synechocystis sp. PCC 6803]|uniref:Uncharacterized protein n=1 Tax=Synechocystis sp. (strain ATCC 27184 / PCC 6803 / Kazusa) TaxID=1111708 RepID=Q6ZEH7_SYNY3|nr:unknown protein [Synechocystis sp. PCC 6803]
MWEGLVSVPIAGISRRKATARYAPSLEKSFQSRSPGLVEGKIADRSGQYAGSDGFSPDRRD